MGSAIARKLSATGIKVGVWNRTETKSKQLQSDDPNIDVHPTVSEAIKASQLTIISLVDNTAALEAIKSAHEALDGKIIVNLSSDAPPAAKLTSEFARSKGARYIGGAMLTPSVIVGTPDSASIVAGPADVVGDVKDVLSIVAPNFTHLGEDIGAAAAIDTALLDAFWTAFAGICHAASLAKANGVQASQIGDQLNAIVGLVATMGNDVARDADNLEFPATISTASSARTTFAHIAEASKASGVDPSLPLALLSSMERVVAAGGGEDSPSRIIADLLRVKQG